MSDKGKLYTLALAILLAVGFIGFGMFLGYQFRDDTKMIGSEVDFTTTVVHDTIFIEKWDTITEQVTRYKLVQVDVHDTIVRNDTLFVELPFTQKHYHEDSLCDVWVSGYEPNLDSLHIVQRHTTEIIRETKVDYKMPRLTAEVGVGGLYMQDRLVGSVGAEVRYNAPKMSYSLGAAYTTDKKAVVGASVGYRFNLIK